MVLFYHRKHVDNLKFRSGVRSDCRRRDRGQFCDKTKKTPVREMHYCCSITLRSLYTASSGDGHVTSVERSLGFPDFGVKTLESRLWSQDFGVKTLSVSLSRICDGRRLPAPDRPCRLHFDRYNQPATAIQAMRATILDRSSNSHGYQAIYSRSCGYFLVEAGSLELCKTGLEPFGKSSRLHGIPFDVDHRLSSR